MNLTEIPDTEIPTIADIELLSAAVIKARQRYDYAISDRTFGKSPVHTARVVMALATADGDLQQARAELRAAIEPRNLLTRRAAVAKHRRFDGESITGFGGDL